MLFTQLASYLSKLEATSLRNQMTVLLAELFKKADEREIDKIGYLSLGRLLPKFKGVEFNMAEKLMIKALARSFGETEEKIKQLFKKSGDLGDVAYKLKAQSSKLKAKTQSVKLSILEVYERLEEIAREAGEGSVERKVEGMGRLITDLDGLSAKYVVRVPLGKLRLGFSDMTILDSLSWMVSGDKSLREKIERAYNIRADVGEIAKKLKMKNEKLKTKIQAVREKSLVDYLETMTLELGTPIVAALCQRLANAEEMVKKMGKVAVEPKYDGTRLQLHVAFETKNKKPKIKNISIFTRNLENVTAMFPDITEAMSKEIKASEAILDGEAIGYDPKNGRFLAFQETIKRKRKYEVAEKALEIPLKYFAFDILYKDGQDLLEKPFKERRQILAETLRGEAETILLTPQILTGDPQEIRKFHDEQIKKGLEGAVLKKWESIYEPGRRGFNWVKFKSEKGKKGGGLSDTIDCLVMGFYRGQGKRTGFGIGAFLVGVKVGKVSKVSKVPKVPEGGFVTVSKIGTGLSDEQWKQLKAKSQKLKAEEKPEEYQVDKNLYPDVWCEPGMVVEIEADNITKSPIHTAGYALRFPRLVRFRDDKGPEQVTTLEELKGLYKMQK